MSDQTPKAKPTALPFRHIGPVLAFSCVINLLYLIGPVFMMQVYDRVIPSGSVPTLVGLFVIATFLYILFGCMDYLRTQIIASEGEARASDLSPKAFAQSLKGYGIETSASVRRRAVEDVAQMRTFLVSSGVAALIDLLFIPVFLIFIFMLHVMLGITALIATAVLVALAVANERTNRAGVRNDENLRQSAQRWVQQVQRQAPYVMANGMSDTMTRIWMKRDVAARKSAAAIAARSSGFASVTKTLRLLIQSLILGIGAYLAVNEQLSAGSMIAASIVFSRTLAPVEQILAQFTPLLRSMDAWARVRDWKDDSIEDTRMAMPAPSQSLGVEIGSLCPPEMTDPVLRNIRLDLNAGQVLGIVGPSGGGKSSLAKALAGAWQPTAGKVVLDSADYREWPVSQLSAAIGYMPQECELFDGTIAENISGFSEETESKKVIEACQLAGAHKLILSLPNGYNTVVGPLGTPLSSGQRQRICLARALYGEPFVVVLDEPNSNLDEHGEAALASAIRRMKDAGKIVIVVAHRQKVLQMATHLCLIENGEMKVFGPKKAAEEHIQRGRLESASQAATPSADRKSA